MDKQDTGFKAPAVEVDGVREIQVMPFGRTETDKGEFVLDEESAMAVIADFDSRANDMVIDYEHQTLSGAEAPAAGWIKKLVFRAPKGDTQGLGLVKPTAHKRGRESLLRAGIWAVVEWTDRAKEYLKNREYRYLSPVFFKRKEDNKVTRLVNAALTNQPAIDGMEPVVNKRGIAASEARNEAVARDEAKKQSQRKEVVMKELFELLGLPEDAALSEVTGTVSAMKKSHESLAMAQESIVALSAKVSELEAALKRRDAEDLAASALKEGKVAPCQRDWAVGYAERDPEGFRVFVAKAPVVVPVGEAVSSFDTGGRRCLLDEAQARVNKALGISEEMFKKFSKEG